MSMAAYQPIPLPKTSLPWGTAFASWLPFLAPPLLASPDSWVYSPLIGRVSFTVCNSTVRALSGIQISLFKANCLSQCYPTWLQTIWLSPTRCLSGPASHQPSPSSSWPLQSPLPLLLSIVDHCYQDRLILQTSAWVHLPAHSLPPTLNYSSL